MPINDDMFSTHDSVSAISTIYHTQHRSAVTVFSYLSIYKKLDISFLFSTLVRKLQATVSCHLDLGKWLVSYIPNTANKKTFI